MLIRTLQYVLRNGAISRLQMIRSPGRTNGSEPNATTLPVWIENVAPAMDRVFLLQISGPRTDRS